MTGFLPHWWPHYWLVYLPLGIIGVVRWSAWLTRKVISLFYRPVPLTGKPEAVSLITPVYDEDPDAFLNALNSWIAERPAEIIAVIDASDTRCISVFQEAARASPVELRLIVTEVPGKRPALAEGIRAAKSDIVALVDSDTLWHPGLIARATAPFRNPSVGGVGTRQNVINAHNIWQRMADVVLDLRYHDEMRFLARVGGQVTCLSGRTALYRRHVLLPILDEFLNESFLGTQCISGEDKRFTYLMQSRGWRSAYQHSARVFTFAPTSFRTFVKQRVRWARNSWRADLRALGQRWTWSHPPFALFLVDRCISPFTALLAPTFMVFAVAHAHWVVAAILAVWWLVSRGVKILPHVLNRPVDILLLPAYVPLTFFLALMKVHALVTVNWQGWLTRGSRSGPRFSQVASTFLSLLGTVSLVAVIGAFVFLYSSSKANEAFSVGPNDKFEVTAAEVAPPFDLAAAESAPALPASSTGMQSALEKLGEKTHLVAPGEDAASIAQSVYGYSAFARVIEYANSNITPGRSIILPRVGTPPVRPAGNAPAIVEANLDAKAIVVSGSGSVSTLSSIARQLPPGLLTQTAPGEWYLSEPLIVTKGASLSLIGTKAGGDVNWLKLRSDAGGFASLQTTNGTIYIEGSRITSWDASTNNFDTNLNDGRAFVLAKSNSSSFPETRMDIVDSELSYLGSASPESYGVSWRVSVGSPRRVTGTVLGSSFHDNYFGAYTYGATDMYWAGNQFFNNAVYGLDPHDGSSGFIVMYNQFHNNGRHGLIFSKRCNDNLIAYNSSFNNGFHGIVLDQGSNNNWVLKNDIHDNFDGIVVFESKANTVLQNDSHANRHAGIRLNGRNSNSLANDNLLAYNTLQANKVHGVMVYGLAERTTIQGNVIEGQAGSGIEVQSASNRIGGPGDLGNVLRGNSNGVVLDGPYATGNLIEGNQVSGSSVWGISLNGGRENVVARNTVSGSGEAALSVEGETATVFDANALANNAYGARVYGCSACRLAANTAASPLDATVKVDQASRLVVEDQAPGEIDLRDTLSLVVLADHNGQVLSLPRHAPSFSSEGGTSVQLHALAPGAHVAFERTNLQLVASMPTAVRLADQSNPTWTVAGQNEFTQTIAGLQADRVYNVFVDGRFYEHVQADASGTAAFQYDGDMSQPRTFELRPG